MQKISWNDINDSDSSLESQPQQEIVQMVKQNHKNQTNKESISNPKIGCDPYSLERLQKHSSSTMWLYITNSNSQKADEIHQLLTKSNHFTQIVRLKTVGWNVETTFEIGRQLIYQGLKGDNFVIKFIYSRKNEQKQPKQQDKQKNNRVQKKVTYVQKGKQAGLKKFNTFTEQPKKKQKIEDQEAYSPRNKDQKQKSKYVQKKNSSNSYNDFKRFQSPRANKNLRDFKSPKRYVEKVATNIESNNPNTVKTAQEKKEGKPNTLQKQSQRIQQVKKDTVEKRVQQQLSKQQKQISLQKKQETKVQLDDESEQEVKQQKKKKNKKKRDGKAKKQQNKYESNNPFSYFSRF